MTRRHRKASTSLNNAWSWLGAFRSDTSLSITFPVDVTALRTARELAVIESGSIHGWVHWVVAKRSPQQR